MFQTKASSASARVTSGAETCGFSAEPSAAAQAGTRVRRSAVASERLRLALVPASRRPLRPVDRSLSKVPAPLLAHGFGLARLKAPLFTRGPLDRQSARCRQGFQVDVDCRDASRHTLTGALATAPSFEGTAPVVREVWSRFAHRWPALLPAQTARTNTVLVAHLVARAWGDRDCRCVDSSLFQDELASARGAPSPNRNQSTARATKPKWRAQAPTRPSRALLDSSRAWWSCAREGAGHRCRWLPP